MSKNFKLFWGEWEWGKLASQKLLDCFYILLSNVKRLEKSLSSCAALEELRWGLLWVLKQGLDTALGEQSGFSTGQPRYAVTRTSVCTSDDFSFYALKVRLLFLFI